MKFLKPAVALAAASAIALFTTSAALSMTVQPVVVNLKPLGSGMSQGVMVHNSFATPLPVELRIEELTFENDILVSTHKDSGDLLVFPPQAMVQPGQTQSFRIQYIGDPELARSKYYYVTVAQLPIKLPPGQSAIQILYNFQVLVSIAPNGVRPALSVASAALSTDGHGKKVPIITVANPSQAHGYLSNGRLVISEHNIAGKEVFRKTLSGPEILQIVGFGLVGAGSTRTMTIPIEIPETAGTIDAKFIAD